MKYFISTALHLDRSRLNCKALGLVVLKLSSGYRVQGSGYREGVEVEGSGWLVVRI